MPRTHRKFITASLAGLLAAGVATSALAAPSDHAKGHGHDKGQHRHRGHDRAKAPVKVTVFSPGAEDLSGRGGVGFIVDLALDATNGRGNALLSPAAGYKPAFNAPVTPAGMPDPHPGADPGAPGLVVLLSSTPTKPGTPFMGPRTNLAGLFQINGVAKVRGLAETWNTWQPQKPLFGIDQHTRLTVYVVAGTAPAVVPAHGLKIISNTVNVPFTIAG
ncbi:MAG: hypothetical protein NVS2B6_17470 [Thermoleophilaceae bacterium]